MKKYTYMILACILVLAGCTKEQSDGVPVSGGPIRFTAGIELTKTSLAGADKVAWAADDLISVNGVTFKIEEIDGSNPSNATFVKADGQASDPEPVEGKYFAYYPAGIAASGLVLPEVQNFGAGNDLSSVNPMYAESESVSLHFCNVCGLLELKLMGEGTVSAIEVDDENTALSGAATVSGKTAVLSSEALASLAGVVLQCGEGVALDAMGKSFYIALPAGDYSSLSINVINDAGKVAAFSLKDNVTASVARNTIYPVTLPVEFGEPAPLKGVFSVSATQTVRFACGNLLYGKNGWAVESSQCGKAEAWDADHVSLFTWTDNGSQADSYSATSSTVVDWGEAYCQQNGLEAGSWTTLSSAQWRYLLEERPMKTASTPRFTNAVKSGIVIGGAECHGLLLYPDSYEGNGVADGISWTWLKKKGIVFLPAAGCRKGSEISGVDSYGYYWAKDSLNPLMSYNLQFGPGATEGYNAFGRYMGYAVRLVSFAPSGK
ncbi:MAG: fimbrillin family protein [Bacteroidales bacterium]|nr:fimbrillin family protein [Bacteroidales bacterium]